MKKSLSFTLALSMLLLISSCGTDSLSTSDTSAASSPASVVTEDQETDDLHTFDGEMTIDFSFGTRTGIYSGEIDNNGFPDGTGTFSANNSDGITWTYTGDWVNGHWEGIGTSSWSTGQVYSGGYSNDIATGEGEFDFPDGTHFVGEFVDDNNANGYVVKDGECFYADLIDGMLSIGGIWRTGAFGTEIDPFQGEWEEVGNKYNRVIISGESINFVHESDIGSKHFCNVTTFYFGFNESGDLIIVNEGDDPRYNISIGEDGILSILGESKDETYEKVSDNIEVPSERKSPEIGMTESEVYASTWGAPKKKNKTTTTQGEREQWVYEDGYIYFENGVVTAIQEM